ncbi:hypothetical protein [Albirhodobacter sp. R86504]|uniref:hypothetical protein n=1 Tax=Albirhodobacter sp. R86504 TaxID=3093848 RepID=UPI00366B5C41
MLGFLAMGVGGVFRRLFWLILFLFSRPGGWAVALALIIFILKFGKDYLPSY